MITTTWDDIEEFARGGTHLHHVGAIAAATQKLEYAIEPARSPSRKEERTLAERISAALSAGFLNGDEAERLHSLREMRNDVIHTRHTPTVDEVLTFVTSVRDACLLLAQRVAARLLVGVPHPAEPPNRRWRSCEVTIRFDGAYLIDDICALEEAQWRLMAVYRARRAPSEGWTFEKLLFVGTANRLARLLSDIFGAHRLCDAGLHILIGSFDVDPFDIERAEAALIEHQRPPLNCSGREMAPWHFGATTLLVVDGPPCLTARIEIPGAETSAADAVEPGTRVGTTPLASGVVLRRRRGTTTRE